MRKVREMGNQINVKAILNGMLAAIAKYHLEVMQRYPDDLLVHDKAMLERVAVPGARIGWMVGHSHTHLVALGFHPAENLHVTYLTNLAPEDRFYVLNLRHGGSIQMQELDRQGFAALSSTAVSYHRKGDASNFWLYCQNRKIGHVVLKSVGTRQDRRIHATITPKQDISGHERVALGIWCSNAVTEMAGSLFVRSTVTWADAIEIALAA